MGRVWPEEKYSLATVPFQLTLSFHPVGIMVEHANPVLCCGGLWMMPLLITMILYMEGMGWYSAGAGSWSLWLLGSGWNY